MSNNDVIRQQIEALAQLEKSIYDAVVAIESAKSECRIKLEKAVDSGVDSQIMNRFYNQYYVEALSSLKKAQEVFSQEGQPYIRKQRLILENLDI